MIKLHTHTHTLLSDTKTPVGIFMALRDFYGKPLLLESSDYNSKQDHFSYICFNPIAGFSLSGEVLETTVNGVVKTATIAKKDKALVSALDEFKAQFDFEKQGFRFCYAGFFGYTGYGAIEHTEDISFREKLGASDIPLALYYLYSLVLVFNHATNALHILSHHYTAEASKRQLQQVAEHIQLLQVPHYPFSAGDKATSNMSDDDFLELIEKAKSHCRLGDVFQLVLSRRFSQPYSGDDFNVYRALRNINPSPYLFYFDTGSFRLFGSSPEAQLIVSQGMAQIHPIAGTYRRTGNDAEDIAKAQQLLSDDKENAEHTMLIDLARNDLGQYCRNVKPVLLKQVQMYSHVIHLVSKVQGTLREHSRPYEILAGTFPAGTLSGAPKHRAMQLIDQYEPTARGFYGGCIGFISNTDELNHAIMIRTFLSRNHTLHYQAGAGIIHASEAEAEKNEVYHKVRVLEKAISEAARINNFKTISHEALGA